MQGMSEALAKVNRALGELGENQDDVAAKLLGRGCLGQRGTPATCPVTVYLNQVFASTRWVALCGRSSVDVFIPEGGVRFAVDLPEPVARFVTWFDGGIYPDLEAES